MHIRTRIKICGLTQAEHVRAAADAGADAIGLVFYPKSPRYIEPEQARELRRSLPAMVDVIALFVNPSQDEVRRVIDVVQPELLQFHGDETPEFCRSFDRRYLRGFRVGGPGMLTPEAVLTECRRFPDAAAWLFDSHSSGYGGSGLSFDPHLLSAVRNAPDSRPLILAGGLKIETVRASIDELQPFGVDVSSGVEDAPGVKSAQKIQRFIAAVYGDTVLLNAK